MPDTYANSSSYVVSNSMPVYDFCPVFNRFLKIRISPIFQPLVDSFDANAESMKLRDYFWVSQTGSNDPIQAFGVQLGEMNPDFALCVIQFLELLRSNNSAKVPKLALLPLKRLVPQIDLNCYGVGPEHHEKLGDFLQAFRVPDLYSESEPLQVHLAWTNTLKHIHIDWKNKVSEIQPGLDSYQLQTSLLKALALIDLRKINPQAEEADIHDLLRIRNKKEMFLESDQLGSEMFEDATNDKANDKEALPEVFLINDEHILKLSKLAETCDKDHKKRVTRILESLTARKNKNNATAFFSAKTDIDFSGFPNFREVAEFITVYIRARHKTNQLCKLPPLLLEGEPGIGKTEFLAHLCEQLGLPFTAINMSSVNSGSYIGGSQIYWSNSRHGVVAEKLLIDGHANPLIFLDEVDKCSFGNAQATDPLGALYSLLESTSSKNFEDVSMPGCKFDASHISWVAGCNNKNVLEDGLLSRFRVFQILPPTKADMRIIIPRIYSSISAKDKWGDAIAKDLNEDVIQLLSTVTPREARMALEPAMARAVANGASDLSPMDVQAVTNSITLGFGSRFSKP